MKPRLVTNPSSAGNVSTPPNWLLTFKVKLLSGRWDQFGPRARFVSTDSFLPSGLETCLLKQRFSSTHYYVSGIRLKAFRAPCERPLQVSPAPSVPWLQQPSPGSSTVSGKDFPAPALTSGTKGSCMMEQGWQGLVTRAPAPALAALGRSPDLQPPSLLHLHLLHPSTAAPCSPLPLGSRLLLSKIPK